MSDERKPLWPVPVEIIGVTGEHESGKTSFCLSICPGPETLVYDFEKSTGTYEADLGFTRIDVPNEMRQKFGNRVYRSLDVFNWWVDHVRSIPVGQYRVIHADPITDIESGLTEFVNSNPKLFGATPGQYAKMSGLMWGHMKEYMKSVLVDVAARVETFTYATHMANVWKGDRPSKDRKAKGKSVLFELASLYIKMERNKDKNVVPSAVVIKHRLSRMQVDPKSEDGDIITVPLVPPRLPVATPAAIRRYMKNPPDYANLKPEERIGETKLSDDEKLEMNLQIAEANRDAALAGADTAHRQEKRLGGVRVGPVASTTQSDEGSASPTQVSDEKVASDFVFDSDFEGNGDNEGEGQPSTQPHGEQVEEALADASATASDPRYPAADAIVAKGLLGSLRQAIARFKAAYPDKHESITRGIAKRNPKAKDESELTNGQAEDMEASLLRILNGPHETTQTKELAAAASAAATATESPTTSSSTPGTGKGVASKATTKRK